MRLIKWMIALLLVSQAVGAVEVVIRTEEKEEKKEEKKEEEEKLPEAPPPSHLDINVYNTTAYNYIVFASIKGVGDQYPYGSIQNEIAPHSSITLATMYGKPGAQFEYALGQVIVKISDEITQNLICTIVQAKKADKEEEKVEEEAVTAQDKGDEDKEENDNGGKEEKTEDKASDKKEKPAKEEASVLTVSNSVTFHFYKSKGQNVPNCAIYFDQ